MARGPGAPLTLAAVLWAVALGPEPEPAARCSGPRELDASAGHTTAVGCTGPGPPLRGPARLLFGGRLDLNHTDLASLEVLPGIGPVRAAAIETARCQRPFASAAELVRVHGIGPTIAARLAPWVEAGAGAPAACSRVD